MTVQERSTEAFVGQVLTDLAACYGGVMVSVGHRLGLYRALAGRGPLSSHDAFEIPASMWFDQERTLEAFRTGAGIPWGEHDGRLYCGIASIYRNAYRASLVAEWLPALDGVVDALEHGARVADIGCGHGYSTVLMAAAFERSRFVGYDTHGASLARAREEADAAGVADRVHFRAGDAASYLGTGYDLICFFDSLHDLGDPVGAARHALGALAPDGTLMVVEPRAGDEVHDNVGPIGHLYYTGSAVLCCAHSRSEDVGLALGAQAGPGRIAAVLREAGFTRVRTAFESPFNMVIEARA